MAKVDMLNMVDMVHMEMVNNVDIVDMVDNMVLSDNVNMVDTLGMVNVYKTFGYLKWLVDTSGWKIWTTWPWWTAKIHRKFNKYG